MSVTDERVEYEADKLILLVDATRETNPLSPRS